MMSESSNKQMEPKMGGSKDGIDMIIQNTNRVPSTIDEILINTDSNEASLSQKDPNNNKQQ